MTGPTGPDPAPPGGPAQPGDPAQTGGPAQPGGPARPGATDSHPGDGLSALLDGELEPAAADAVRSHLTGCAECREELARLADARSLLRGMAAVEPPPGLVERFGIRLRRVLRLAAGGVALAGAGMVALLFAASPERAVRPPVEPTGSPMPVLPAGTTISAVPAGYWAPASLDGLPLQTMRRVGAMLGALYGSGGHDLLVLEEPGQLVVDTSYKAAATSMGGHEGLSVGGSGDEAFTWQDGPAVVTLVGSAEDVAAAAPAMQMRARPQSLLDRARRMARDLVEDITGSD